MSTNGKRKRRMQRWIAFLTVCLCTMSLTGCSGKKDEPEKRDGKSGSAVATESVSHPEQEEKEIDSSAEITPEPLETESIEKEESAGKQQEKTDSKDESPKEEQKSASASPEPEKKEPVPEIKVENYILDGKWKNLKDDLELQPTESRQFPETGEAYETEGFYMNWVDYPTEDDGAFTMINTGSTLMSFYGITVGDGIKKADTVFRDQGWKALDDGRQYIVIYNGCSLAVDFELDADQVIQGWYLCNWPEGDFSENFVDLENQQIGGVSAAVHVYEGEYGYDLSKTGLSIPEYYTVMIENVTEKSFDFTIYYVNVNAGSREVVFRTHTAIFEEDGTVARYHGSQYELEFTFPNDRNCLPDVVDMQISGYEPIEGMTFCNNTIPGHEFS